MIVNWSFCYYYDYGYNYIDMNMIITKTVIMIMAMAMSMTGDNKDMAMIYITPALTHYEFMTIILIGYIAMAKTDYGNDCYITMITTCYN